MRHQKISMGNSIYSNPYNSRHITPVPTLLGMVETFLPTPFPSTSMTSAIKAVVIRPNGDVSLNHLSRFTDKYILPTDPIFHDVLPTEMSVRLELPLLIQRLNVKDVIPGDTYHKNRPATFLQMRPCIGFASTDWQRSVGAVLVVRMDRKPLCCLHLEAIWRYHWTLLSDVNSIARQTGLKEMISRQGFENFWYEYRKKQIEAGREDFEDLVSPYDF
jgi:hypothetical protein